MLSGFNRTLLVGVFLLISTCLCSAQHHAPSKSGSAQEKRAINAEFDPKNWKKFSSEDGRFSAMFPTPPLKETKQLASMLETVTMPIFTATTNAEYSVAYADYPFPIEGTEKLVPFMDAVQNAGVQGVGGQLLEQNELSFAGHAGRFYRVEFGGGYILNAKMLVVGNRVYLIAATTYGKKARVEVAQAYEKFAKRFLDSFQLISPGDRKPTD